MSFGTTGAARGRRAGFRPAAALVAFLAVALTLTAGCSRPAAPWNVLLVTFDTTRADRIGCYGNTAIETPTLDGLAAAGVRFAQAYSSVPITLPSHTSLLTGRFPLAHGVRDNGIFVVPPEQLTLAEMLAEHGYATAAAVGSFPLTARFGLDQGFDLFDDRLVQPFEGVLGPSRLARPSLFFDERRAARVNEAVFDWLAARQADPFFLWVHYFDPHQPFEPPPPYDQLYADDLYNGEIAYADESLGVLLDHLRDLGLDDNTLIVFTSDHGEGLGEHDEATHSIVAYDTTLHVPLIIRPPSLAPSAAPAGSTVEARVRQVDVVPTVLELLGLPRPETVQGRSLVPHLAGEAVSPFPHYAETLSPRLTQGWGELRALYDGPYKYIHGPRPELYDITADPSEVDDLIDREPALASAMRGKLETFIGRHSAATASQAVPLDDETRRRLMALGYLQAGGGEMEEIREVLRSDGVPPQDRVGDISDISRAKDLLHRKQPLAAAETVHKLLAANPDNPFYRSMLADAEVQRGRIDEALPILDALLAEGYTEGPVEGLMLEVGHRLYLRGEVEAGLARVRRSIAARPTAPALYLLALMEADQGRREAEMAALRRALELDESFAPARLDLAVRQAESGDRAAAASAFARVLGDHPYYAKAHYNYGAFLVAGSDAAEALPFFTRAVELDPGYAQAYYAVIALHLSLGAQEAAETTLETLEARLPNAGETARARRLLETHG